MQFICDRKWAKKATICDATSELTKQSHSLKTKQSDLTTRSSTRHRSFTSQLRVITHQIEWPDVMNLRALCSTVSALILNDWSILSFSTARMTASNSIFGWNLNSLNGNYETTDQHCWNLAKSSFVCGPNNNFHRLIRLRAAHKELLSVLNWPFLSLSNVRELSNYNSTRATRQKEIFLWKISQARAIERQKIFRGLQFSV